MLRIFKIEEWMMLIDLMITHINKSQEKPIQHVPTSICNSFFAKQENTFQSHMRKDKIIFSRKIKWILHKNKKRIYNDISPILWILSIIIMYRIISRIKFVLLPWISKMLNINCLFTGVILVIPIIILTLK